MTYIKIKEGDFKENKTFFIRTQVNFCPVRAKSESSNSPEWTVVVPGLGLLTVNTKNIFKRID